MIERKRKLVEELLRSKFKVDIDVEWQEGFHGNQIIFLNIPRYDFRVVVEIDNMMFIDNIPAVNVDCILYWVKKHIIDYIICY